MNILPICKFFNNSFNFLSESPVFFRNACVFFLFFSILSLRFLFHIIFLILFCYNFNVFCHSITISLSLTFSSFSTKYSHFIRQVPFFFIILFFFKSFFFFCTYFSLPFSNQRYSIQNQHWTIFVKLSQKIILFCYH